MASEDFIQLTMHDASGDDAGNNLDMESAESDVQTNDSASKVCREGFGGIEDLSQQTGEHDNVGVRQGPVLQKSANVIEIDSTVESKSSIEASFIKENGCSVTLSASMSGNRQADENRKKQARMTCIDNQPSVHVVYSSLTSESKKKLTELLQQWSEWQAQHELSGNDSSKETLECGEETYFPALHVGIEKSSMVSFWVDNIARKEDNKEYTPIDGDSVPLYDRGYVLGCDSLEGSYNSESLERMEASRCFNCGSYSHSLNQCSRPRDNVAISNARKLHSVKKNSNANARSQARYYQNSPGKFDDLKAGVLGPETRECLGIGALDPPPWLQRMREIGYPPGYLDVKEEENQHSGITIYEDYETKMDYEEGELPERGVPIPAEKKMTVEFPGINAPIPENADHRQWVAISSHSSSDSRRNRSQYNSNRSLESHRGHHHDSRRVREYREDGPPASGHHGLGSSAHSYSPRYSPYDHDLSPRSPNLGRSLSERGWRSSLPHEGSPGYGQIPQYSGMHRQSPLHYSSTASFERWAPEVQYIPNPDASLQGRSGDRDRQDHHSYNRR